MNGFTQLRIIGIALRRHHYANSRVLGPLQVAFAQATYGRRKESPHHDAHEPRHAAHRRVVDVVEEVVVAESPEPEAPSDFKSAIARFECELLEKALADARFNQRAAAKALGLSYDQFRHSLRKHGLMPG